MGEIVFITGTSTGVGKTVLTGLLLRHWRAEGLHALGLKPFCTGPRGDVRHLRRLQDKELTEDEINPFHYPRPVAPLVAEGGRGPGLTEVLRYIRRFQSRCEVLLVEGAGGLLAPLGNAGPRLHSPYGCYTAREIVRGLECRALVVAPNRLGTLNHTLLTVEALGQEPFAVVLIEQRRPDLSSETNARVLRKLLAPIEIVSLPYLGASPLTLLPSGRNLPRVKSAMRRLTKLLAYGRARARK